MALCKICQNKPRRVKCIFCGTKPPKKEKKKKEITRADRRTDFLGHVYNQMCKCGMETTGLIGEYYGETVIICEIMEDVIEVQTHTDWLIVMREEVSDVRPNNTDLAVRAKIGDPLTGPLYKPLYKPKKNEV